VTALNKPVTRRSDATVRDRGRSRRIVVTLYPNGTVGLRQEKTRREEIVSLASCWGLAVKQRVAQERADKKKGKVGR
jgi:hypothetical protein